MRSIVIILGFYLFSAGAHAACPKEINSDYVEQTLTKLYPHQNKQIINKRLDNTENSFMFLRAYVPYYYHLFKECFAKKNLFQDFKNFEGLVAGDAHLMNFGTVQEAFDGKKVLVTLNDPDDGGHGYHFLDFVRFLSSYQIMLAQYNFEDEADLKPLLKSYLKGVTDSKFELSSKTKKLIKKSKGKATPSSKWVDIQNKKFKARKDGNYSITAATEEELTEIVAKEFKGKLIDAYGLIKYTGGSGALNRFEVLAELPKWGVQWLEFKKIAPKPGLFPMAPNKQSTVQKRYEENITFQQSKKALKLFRVVNVKAEKYLIRFRFSGNKDYGVDELDESTGSIKLSRVKTVAVDQAYLLGKLHRKDLKQKKSLEYRSKFKKYEIETFVDFVLKINSLMIRSFNSI